VLDDEDEEAESGARRTSVMAEESIGNLLPLICTTFRMSGRCGNRGNRKCVLGGWKRFIVGLKAPVYRDIGDEAGFVVDGCSQRSGSTNLTKAPSRCKQYVRLLGAVNR
jgi:hypothetical protein